MIWWEMRKYLLRHFLSMCATLFPSAWKNIYIYIYMVDKEQAPKISTMKATVRMPINDRVNGLLDQSHCFPFMTYMFTNRSVFTESEDTFCIIEVYVAQHALHAHVEGQHMCLFSRDHMSPTLAFDYNYDFNDQERSLERLYRVSLLNDSTLTNPLEKYNFSTGLL